MMRHILLCALLMAVLSFIATPALADNGCGYGCGYGWGYGYGWLYNSLRYEVPHFAAYPPVYYSYPVPRTYGYSPFAYPPNVMTPEVVEEVKAAEILNPYVPQEKSATPQTDRAAGTSAQPQPLVIINPFVSQNHTVAQQ